MIDPVIYTYIEDPYNSRTVSLEGSADGDTFSFVYSPTGGNFSSTIVGTSSASHIEWSYQFVLMSQSEEFFIKTIDSFGNESSEQKKQINYGVSKPIILLPGKIKSITGDTAVTGSTSTKFLTLNGDFKNDGIIKSDVVLSTTGKNIGEYRSILVVGDKYIETEEFPHPWDLGDKIKVYPKEDRPTMMTDEDVVAFSGKCDKNISKVKYSTEELVPVRVYASNTQPYLINTLNNNLLLNIDGKLEFILLPSGSLTSQDMSDAINEAFRKTFTYDVSFYDGERFFLESQHIQVYSGTANTTLGIVECEVNFTLEIEVPNTIIFKNNSVGGASCSKEVIDSGLLFGMNIDGIFIRFPLKTNTVYTKLELIDSINKAAGKEVAFDIGNKIVFGASENIWVEETIDDLNLYSQFNGNANYNIGLNLSEDIGRNPNSTHQVNKTSLLCGSVDNSGDWSFNLNIIQPLNTVKVYGLNEFFKLLDPVSLSINYQVPAPTVHDFPPSVDTDFVDLSGTYTSRSKSVLINDVPVDLSNKGNWTHQYNGLSLGTNNLKISSIDAFNNQSSSTNISITRIDPYDVNYPTQGDGNTLKWKSVSNPTLSPDSIKKVADTIDSIFNPIVEALDFVSGLLDIAKAFINEYVSGPLAALRRSIQALLDNILGLLDSLVNGAGLYTLSTLAPWSDIKRDIPWGLLDPIKGSFPDFFNIIENSFYDNFDAYRPQLHPESTVGGLILALGDGSGMEDLLNAYKSLSELLNKQRFDYGLDPVNNLKAEGQNQRVVLTWTAPDGGSNIFPYDYVILRSKKSGGEKKTQQVKSQVSAEGKGNQYYEEDYYNPDTGKQEGIYTEIGRVKNYRVMKEFKFIDGTTTLQENENQKGVNSFVSGTLDFFTACREFVLVSMNSSNVPLVNGDTYFYKVVPMVTGTSVRGDSPEVVCAASFPQLEQKTEYLYDQIKTTKAGYYQVKGSMFDKDTALFADTANDMSIKVDGAKVIPVKFYSEKGLFVLPNPPKQTLEITYWGKKEQSATRASITGTELGPFSFKESENTLGIQVGRGATITEQFGGTPITRTQTVTFTRFKTGESSVDVSAEEVASVIRSQTSGLKVSVDHRNRIVLEEDQNPDIYRGSYIKIVTGNKVLGFTSGQESSAGPLMGIPPDWKSIRISDLFPAVNDLIRYLKDTFDQLSKGLASATDSLIDFIDLLQAKIDALSDMIKKVQSLLKRMANILALQGGIYVLVIPPKSGGATYFNTAIKNSTGYPLDAEYAGGLVFLYTDGGTGVALDWIISSLK